MAKRFITTDLFKDAWFMDLPNKYKLFWVYLITDCDYTGVWQVNYKVAQFYVGDHLEPVECERILSNRIIKIEEGKYWFIPKFIEFQYGHELSYANPAVRKVILKLEKENLFAYIPNVLVKGLQSSFKGAEEKEEEEVKEEVINRMGEFKNVTMRKKDIQTMHNKYGEDLTNRVIDLVSSQLEDNPKYAKQHNSHYGMMTKWAIKAVLEKNPPRVLTQSQMAECEKKWSPIRSKYNYDQGSQKFRLK